MLAERILNAYEKLDEEGRLDFFQLLYSEYDIDIDTVRVAIDIYGQNPDADNLVRVTKSAELFIGVEDTLG